MGDDGALLRLVAYANIVSGLHAGDPDVMAVTMAQAAANGVGIGAHPGFADQQGFGRRRMQVPLSSLANAIRYQVAAADGMARAAGARLQHVKLHGALANMASEDAALAEACFTAALEVVPDLIVMVLAATAQESAARAIGCRRAGEIFADRAYNDDATLVDRRVPGAMIRDPALAGARMAQMVQDGAIIAESGKRIPTRIDTICLHGDTPEALEIARAVRTALEGAGIAIRRLAP